MKNKILAVSTALCLILVFCLSSACLVFADDLVYVWDEDNLEIGSVEVSCLVKYTSYPNTSTIAIDNTNWNNAEAVSSALEALDLDENSIHIVFLPNRFGGNSLVWSYDPSEDFYDETSDCYLVSDFKIQYMTEGYSDLTAANPAFIARAAMLGSTGRGRIIVILPDNVFIDPEITEFSYIGNTSPFTDADFKADLYFTHPSFGLDKAFPLDSTVDLYASTDYAETFNFMPPVVSDAITPPGPDDPEDPPEDPQDPDDDFASILGTIDDTFTFALSCVSDVASVFVNNPILLMFLTLGLVGLAVGLFKRLINK